MTNSAPSFGRRRAPTADPSTSAGITQSERDRLLYRSLTRDPAAVPSPESASALKVPNSIGAGILTGAVVGVASLATHVQDGAPAGLHLGPFAIDLGTSTLPLMLGLTLWTGARAGFMAAFGVHGLLRRIHRTTFADYAITGALIGLALSAALHVLGFGEGDLLWQTALGAASGALYRLFAGAAPPA